MRCPQDENEVTTVCYDTTGDSECLHLPAHPINPHPHPNITIYPACDPMTEEHHAAYFASLDPALVRALLRLAEAMMRYPQGTSWADYDELVAAENEFRALAADRVAVAVPEGRRAHWIQLDEAE